MIQSMSETIRQSEMLRLDLIQTELAMAFTFAQIAFQSADGSDKRSRNTCNARKAYEEAVHLAARGVQDEALAQKLQEDLSALRLHLVSLGEANLDKR